MHMNAAAAMAVKVTRIAFTLPKEGINAPQIVGAR